MTYERPVVTVTVMPGDPKPETVAAIWLFAVVLAADAGTWVWATRRISRSSTSVSGPKRSPLRVVMLPARQSEHVG